MQSTVLARVVALTSESIWAWASTYFPGLSLDGIGFKAEADNSGQNGSKSLLHPSTANNKVLKVDEIKFTLLATSAAHQASLVAELRR